MPIKTYRPSNVPEYYLKNIPDSENILNAIPFSFSSAFTGAATIQQLIQTLADSDFLCISLQSDNVSVIPNVVIRDLSTNWPLQNTPVPIVSIFGTGALPYFLPIPWYVSKKTTIELSVTQTAAVAQFTLSLSGLRIFRR